MSLHQRAGKKAVQEDPLLDKAWILITNLYFLQENYQKKLDNYAALKSAILKKELQSEAV